MHQDDNFQCNIFVDFNLNELRNWGLGIICRKLLTVEQQSAVSFKEMEVISYTGWPHHQEEPGLNVQGWNGTEKRVEMDANSMG